MVFKSTKENSRGMKYL